MNLYEIRSDYLQFLDMIADGQIPEEAVADTLASLEGEIQEKCDNIASYIKELNAEAKAIKDEENALSERRKAKENKAERLTKYLADFMVLSDQSKIETPRNRISFRSSKYLFIEDWAELDERFLRVKAEPDKTALKEAIENGEVVSGVELRERRNLQIK